MNTQKFYNKTQDWNLSDIESLIGDVNYNFKQDHKAEYNQLEIEWNAYEKENMGEDAQTFEDYLAQCEEIGEFPEFEHLYCQDAINAYYKELNDTIYETIQAWKEDARK